VVLGASKFVAHSMSGQSTPNPNVLVAITNLKFISLLQNFTNTLVLISAVEAAVNKLMSHILIILGKLGGSVTFLPRPSYLSINFSTISM